MNKTLKATLIGVIIPGIVIIAASKLNIWLGIVVLLIYLAGVVYLNRGFIFSIFGSRQYSLGKTDEALKWFRRSYETKKVGIRIYVSYAYILLKKAELAKSEEVLQEALDKFPQSQDIPYTKSILALVLWKKGDLDDAVAMLEEVMKSYKTTSIYGSLGYLLILQGDYEKALEHNLAAYEYNSNDKIIQDNLGLNYYLLDKYDESRKTYEALLEKSPTFPDPYFNFGLLLLKLNEPEKAIEYMKKALEYNFSYLSSLTKEQVEAKIQEASAGL